MGGEKIVLKKLQSTECPNPKCKRRFENLIVIYDKSKNQLEKFYGCPYCFFKIDNTETISPKWNEKTLAVEKTLCVTNSEEEKISNCPKYFGFLAEYFSNSIIPIECLDCTKMTDCMKC